MSQANTKETSAQGSLKSRRDYMTVSRDPRVPSERVRVTGFAQVRVGFGPNERLEQWCRVRFADGGRLLMHPTNLVLSSHSEVSK
jgi:hypothetical protein